MAEEWEKKKSNKKGENPPEIGDSEVEENSVSKVSDNLAIDLLHSRENLAPVTSRLKLNSNRLTPVTFITKVIGWMREAHGSTVAGMRRYVIANFDVNSESLLTTLLWKGVALGMACGAVISPAKHRGRFKVVTEESKWRTTGRSVWTKVEDNDNAHCVACERRGFSSDSATNTRLTFPTCRFPVDDVPGDVNNTGHESEDFSSDLNGNCFHDARASSDEGASPRDTFYRNCAQSSLGKIIDADNNEHTTEHRLIHDKCIKGHPDLSKIADVIKGQTTDSLLEEGNTNHHHGSARNADHQNINRQRRAAPGWNQQGQFWWDDSSNADCPQRRWDNRTDGHRWAHGSLEGEREDHGNDVHCYRPNLPVGPSNHHLLPHRHVLAAALLLPSVQRLPDATALSAQTPSKPVQGIGRPVRGSGHIDTDQTDQHSPQHALHESTPPILGKGRCQENGSRTMRERQERRTSSRCLTSGQRSTRGNMRQGRLSDGGRCHGCRRGGNATPRQRGRRGGKLKHS